MQEHHFYTEGKLQKYYDSDKNYQATTVEPLDSAGNLDEPALHFHEFLFLLGLIAHQHVNSSSTIAEKIQDFYVQRLGFQKRSEKAANRDLTYEEVLARVYRAEEGGDRLRPYDDGESAEGSGDEEGDYYEEESEDEENS